MIRPDWTKAYASLKDIQDDLRIEQTLQDCEDYLWLESKSDTILIKKSYESYIVHVWNNPDARAILANVVSKPIQKVVFEKDKV